jgi:hypothetical protein
MSNQTQASATLPPEKRRPEFNVGRSLRFKGGLGTLAAGSESLSFIPKPGIYLLNVVTYRIINKYPRKSLGKPTAGS